jgi:hypothetical protein
MQKTSKTKGWQTRRFRWPAALLAILAVCAGMAFKRANDSRVVVYNQSGTRFTSLTITACGQSHTFREVEDRESVRFELARAGTESDIEISTNGLAMWRGDYIEPRGGYRTTIRLRSDGQVQSTTTTSWLRSVLTPAPDA